MREVFGEHGFLSFSRRASHKTDRSRGCKRAVKPRQNACEHRMLSNEGISPPWGQVWGYLHGSIPVASRAPQFGLSLKKGSSGVVKRHHSTTAVYRLNVA